MLIYILVILSLILNVLCIRKFLYQKKLNELTDTRITNLFTHVEEAKELVLQLVAKTPRGKKC